MVWWVVESKTGNHFILCSMIAIQNIRQKWHLFLTASQQSVSCLFLKSSSAHKRQRSWLWGLVYSKSTLFYQQLAEEGGSHSHHKRTVAEFVCNPTETISSNRSQCGCFGSREFKYCVHICPNEPHQREKRTRVWFNRTKQSRCENKHKNWRLQPL